MYQLAKSVFQWFRFKSLLAITLIASLLTGCVSRAIDPEITDVNLSKSQILPLEKIVLTKFVTLEYVDEVKGSYYSEKRVKSPSVSKFGKEHELANIDCIAKGVKDLFKKENIIKPNEFWETIGRNKDELKLSSLLELPIEDKYGLDYLLIAYHQRIDIESYAMEAIVEGGFRDVDREIVAVVIVDINKSRVLNAIEVKARHEKIMAHVIFVIPFGANIYPSKDPCYTAGIKAARIISQHLTANKSPLIAIVAAKTNPYSALYELRSTETLSQNKPKKGLSGKPQQIATIKKSQSEVQLQRYYDLINKDRRMAHYWLCKSADKGNPDARYRLAVLYENGSEGINKNIIKSYMWYMLANESKHYWSKHHIVRLRKELLGHSEYNKFSNVVDNWKPGQCEIDLGLNDDK